MRLHYGYVRNEHGLLMKRTYRSYVSSILGLATGRNIFSHSLKLRVSLFFQRIRSRSLLDHYRRDLGQGRLIFSQVDCSGLWKRVSVFYLISNRYARTLLCLLLSREPTSHRLSYRSLNERLNRSESM